MQHEMSSGCFLTLPLPKPEQVVQYARELRAMGYIIIGVMETELGFILKYRRREDAEQPK